MARGEDTSKHPNRGVGRENFISGPPAGWTMNNLVNGLVGQSDSAPAGGIPQMSDEQKQRMYGGIKPNFPLPDSRNEGDK
jgi:hypothetical protein